MAQTVLLTHDYAAPPMRVWEIATDLDGLQHSMGSLIIYEGLPGGRLYQGQSLDVSLSLLGLFPPAEWQINIETFDPRNLLMQTREHGKFVKRWDTHTEVVPTSSGALLKETIVVDAGWLTPAFALLARFVYQHRHKPRLQFLGLAD